jgi:hypothetical protein
LICVNAAERLSISLGWAGPANMQFLNMEVVVAILLFAGAAAFVVLVYAAMRTLFGTAAHTIALIIGHASNIFHNSRSSLSETNRPPPAAPSEKPNAQDKR